MRQVLADLERLRRRSRAMLVVQRIAVTAAWIVAVMLVLIGLDWLFRMPAAMRFVLLLGGLAALGWGVWSYLLPAMRFRPTLTQLALRVERSLPNLSGWLASGVEFAASGADRANPLAARSIEQAQSRLGKESVRRFSNAGPTMRDLGIMLLVFAISAVLVASNPAGAHTGVMRLFAPFGEAAWPARTGVASLMHEVVTPMDASGQSQRAGEGDRAGDRMLGVFPQGQALPLRAEVTRGELGQRVSAWYRFIVGGERQSWQHVVLTQQGAGAIHERLLDTTGTRGREPEALEIYFATYDHQTSIERVRIVTPPAVRSAALEIEPPAYARETVSTRLVELGPGTDGRAVTDQPSLIGSQATLTFTLNKALPVPERAANEEAGAFDQWLRETLDWADDELPAFTARSEAAEQWTLRWQVARTRVISLNLEDEYGLRNPESIVYRIEATDDHPPSVTITDPATDDVVLPAAVIALAAEAQDDVGVLRLGIEARVQPEGRDGPVDEVRWSMERGAEDRSSRRMTLRASMDLEPLGLSPGDIVHINAVAEDGFELDGRSHDPAVSSTRRLRVIDDLEMASRLRRDLSGVRQSAIRLESRQSELQGSVIEDSVQPGIERAQAEIAERIAEQREAIEEIRRQMQANRLDDAQLENLLQQSADLVDFAGRAASQAVEEAQRRRGEGPAQRPDAEDLDEFDTLQPADEDRDLVDAQQEVREELSDLIELLDRDEDTWVITRQLEGLLREQADLERATGQLAQRTMGQARDEMSEADLSELDRIALRQRELQDLARQLVESLRQRAEGMDEFDPHSASGMRTAADTAEQRELDRDMQDAADRVEQNQLRSARSGQQAAAETIQRMLQDIEQTDRARAEQLLRQLASLIESIERLITVQENELMALARAIEREDFTGRDRAMIRLNQNTQAVAAEARAAGQEVRRVARVLDRAADAQGSAISALRAAPVRADEAEASEQRSLELLQEARDLAQELQEQAEREEVRRQQEELLAGYRELLERQIALKQQTEELSGRGELDRRQLVEARRLSNRQDELRSELRDLGQSAQEVADSPIFSHIHRRIDDWSREVSASLLEGEITARTMSRQDRIARSIARIIEALEDAMQPPEDFDQAEGDGGGAGESQPVVIPPMAELRLLRGLQEEVYNQTRQAHELTDADEAQRREMLRDIGQQQRELMDIGRELVESMQR